MKIAGIDPGINSVGKCIMTLDDSTYDITDVQLYGYNKVKKRCLNGQNCQIFHLGSKYTEKSIFERQDIAYNILLNGMEEVKHVSFEGYAYGYTEGEAQSRGLIQMGEFIGGIKKMFYDKGMGIIIYPPRMVKRFATGNGNAGKNMMCEMFEKEFPKYYPDSVFIQLPQFEDPHADICDAFWIAETLRNHLIYEILGIDSLNKGTVASLEFKSISDSESIVETKLVKKPLLN